MRRTGFSFLVIVLFSFSIGCKKLQSNEGGSNITTNPDLPDITEPVDPPVVEAQQIKFLPGLVRQSQILSSVSKCLDLNVTDLSAVTKDRYRSLKGNLSEEGSLGDLSGPLLMAVTQIAGDVCNDLIQKESQMTMPNFLESFDLSADVVSGAANLEPSVDKITKACWGRTALESEKELILETYEATSLKTNRGKRAALFLCTALMSSSDIILN